MATIVCRNLQSSLDSSQVIEPRTLLRLKLSSPKPAQFSQIPLELAFKSCFLDSSATKEKSEEKKERNEHMIHVPNQSNADVSSCWGSLNSIFNGGGGGKSSLKESKTEKEQSIYVHPLVKRSSYCKLSEKSLELCTENLGCETGTESSEEINDLFSAETTSYYHDKRRQVLEGRKRSSNRTSTRRNFPPPLTTISGAEPIQVRPHREDGRLIINAVKAPSTRSMFHVERSNGRLRMSVLRDSSDSDEAEEDFTTEKVENETNYGGEEQDEQEKEMVEDEGTEKKEGINENNKEFGGKSVIKNFKRPCRCKEGESGGTESRGILNMETFWVAT